ncbi:hypothetical protein IW261DRAFT_8601 [Armillaria novae-zelandiae]|uniref:Uncharacterized protein n=1 Tax=Armillaria novae-zelandiae TaxID=153914 RepID=A0AA39UI58_9AGAR|nr:hypothetical protein IW261DRAFT_8601 [Armillaria novae-zelandiae]
MSEVDFSFCYWSRNIQYIDYAYVFIVILYYFGDEDMDFFFYQRLLGRNAYIVAEPMFSISTIILGPWLLALGRMLASQ